MYFSVDRLPNTDDLLVSVSVGWCPTPHFCLTKYVNFSCEQALVRRAEDVIHTLAETIPITERKPAEPWLDDLARLKENLLSAVQHPYQILRSVSDFHHTCNRVCAVLPESNGCKSVILNI